MCTNCNQNNCGGCTQEINICTQCVPEQPCDCAAHLSSDCITYDQDNIECNSVVVVAKNTILSDAISNIVSWSCTKFAELAVYFRIINVGIGASIYAGDNLIGEKKLRKLKSTDNSVVITQGTDDINFTVPEVTVFTYSATNTGTGAQVYKDSTIVGDNTQFNLRKLKSSDSSVSITEGANDIDITVVTGSIPDGSETKVTAGTNTSVTGTGTIASPYIINNTAPDQVVSLTQGGATTITGTYPNFTISSVNTVADGSETKLNSGTTTTVTGSGTIASPYVVEAINLQKVITYPANFTGTNYTLTSADNNYSILINNASTAVTITIPTGLSSKISVGFIQQGTADISFVSSGTTINTPVGLKIKGQNYNAYIEKVGVTETFHLLGNLKL